MNGRDTLTEEGLAGQPASPAATAVSGKAPARHGHRAQPRAKAPRGETGTARLALSNWPVSVRLVAVFAIASVTGMVLGGLRIAGAVSTSQDYGRTVQLAVLGQRVLALTQAMQDERDLYAGLAAYHQLAADAAGDGAAPALAGQIAAAAARQQASLTRAEKITDEAADQMRSLAAGIGPAFPLSVQGKAEVAINMASGIPAMRSELVRQPSAEVIGVYSVDVGELLVLNDEIVNAGGDTLLADQVRALGALSRAKDEASQQRALLDSALLEVSVNDAGGGKKDPGSNNISSAQALADAGGLGSLIAAQGTQFTDVSDFTNAATPAEINAYLTTVAGPQDDAAQTIEGFVALTGDPRSVFEGVDGRTLGMPADTVAGSWYSDMSATMSQMRQVETQVMGSILSRSRALQNQADDAARLTAEVTLAALLLVLLATALVSRTLANPLRRLQADALEIATVRLPARVAAAAAGTGPAGRPAVIEPIGIKSTDEIGKVARAFDQVHAEAVRLASTEAQLRSSLSAMFISLSRRSVPLIDRLARMIDGLEQSEDDPDHLANLFSMDHLVTRMRRNSENLLVLAGEEPVRRWAKPVPLSDVTSAATAEIEQYSRVTLSVQPGLIVSGQAAADVVHLLAELIENATQYSAKSTQVHVTVTELSGGGVIIEVRDGGVGIDEERLAEMNSRLDDPPALDVSISRHMGLYAVAHLAARHGIRVKLRPGTSKGLSALVWLPGSLAGPEPVPAGGSRVPRSASGEQPPLAGSATEEPPRRSAWFAAKRPSGDPAGSAAEPAAGWARGAGTPHQGGQVSAGLPRRTPLASAHPGATGRGEQAMPRRRSPQAARDRLSGFRIGSPDTLPTGSEPARASHEIEGNNA